jgi:YebC/PmpR family DNA-binding regulatory protein
MAGHSKWANIQHRKKAQDSKRGKLFTRLIREITVAARMGGGDISTNPRLRLAVDKGLSANMPKDTVERAIKRGVGEGDDVNYEEVRYEGFGPGGVAVIVDCLTDNRNRTVAEVRHAFNKAGGNLGTSGSVAYMFTATGMLSYPEDVDEDAIMEAAIEAGAEDVRVNDNGSLDVLTKPENFLEIKTAMIEANLVPEKAEITMLAENYVTLDEADAQKMLRLQDTLEELDDTQEIYSNADISEEVLAKLET